MEVSFKPGSDGKHTLYVSVPDEHAAALGKSAEDVATDAAETYASHNNFTASKTASGRDDVAGISPTHPDAEHFVFNLAEVTPQAGPEKVEPAKVEPVKAPVSTASVDASK